MPEIRSKEAGVALRPDVSGEEIHAETTRLRIRSMAHRARKIIVEDAAALSSERKTPEAFGTEWDHLEAWPTC